MKNIPQLKLGLVSVSRDCFLIDISLNRRMAVAKAYEAAYGPIYNCSVTVENERDMLRAMDELRAAGCNALVVFLGNFGPETSETLFAKYFDGPVMYVAAAEEDIGVLSAARGDAFCGVLNCSYNLGLRNLRAFLPEYPVGTAEEVADMIADFRPIATALIGVSHLKIITFGPRPQDFLACNAPIKPLFDLGVEIEENSELDLLVEYRRHEGDSRIPAVAAEMRGEIAVSDRMAGVLDRLAQYELTLLDVAEAHRGSCDYVAFANKCWPSFETEFGFVPCYVNSRLTAMGIPVACEVDIYGALSEYIGLCVSGQCVTLLDANNTVPAELFEQEIQGTCGYRQSETFMGFHCGNTSACMLREPKMSYQLIMHRTLEPDRDPDITRGTIEGDLKPGGVTFYRLQSTAEGELKAYVAQGEVLPARCHSFGSIGVIAIPEMERFYRHVMIEKHYPHHGAVAQGHWGKVLFEVFKYLGVRDIAYNRPRSLPYPTENPFA